MALRGGMPTQARTAWLLGLVLGVLDGFLGFEFPTLALVLIVVAAALLTRDASRFAGLGGLLLGAGGTWVVVLMQAQARCTAFNASPNQECVMSDVTPIVVASGIVAAVGLGLTLVAARRSG